MVFLVLFIKMNVHSNDAFNAYSSQWIQAHAGSGKTYQVVEHITRLLLSGEQPSSILCLTYTKAAAGEMEQRLKLKLRELAFMPNHLLDATLKNTCNVVVSPELIKRARGLMVASFDDVAGVQFHTVHGFCQYVLTQCTVEAGLPLGFDLLNEEKASNIRTNAFCALLNEAMTDVSLRSALSKLQTIAKDAMVEGLLYEGLKARRSWQELFSAKGNLAAVLLHIKSYFKYVSEDIIHSTLADRYNEAWLSRARNAAALLSLSSKQDKERARFLEQWADTLNISKWLVYAEQYFSEKGNLKSHATVPFAKKNPEIATWLEEEKNFVKSMFEQIARTSSADMAVALTILMHRMFELIEDEKKRVQALDFDDLLIKVRGLLADEFMRAWLMSKLDNRIKHLLLDEAQDTSPEQWEIISMLREDLWQSSADNARSLLVVGDLKQSIYSFQGAQPQKFVEQEFITKDYFHALGLSLTDMSLDTSRRSAPLIMQLVDKVLESTHLRKACISDAAMRSHITVHAGQPSRICCFPPIPKLPRHATQMPAPLLGSVENKNAVRNWADTLACTIEKWLQEPRMLAGRGRAVAAGDILILLQARKNAADIIQALEKRHIPVSGLDRLVLNTHLAVRDHLALLEWALHPYDDYHLAIALRSPLGGLTEEALFQVAHARGDLTLWDALIQVLPDSLLVMRFMQWRQWILTLPIDEALARIHAEGVVRYDYSKRFGAEVLEVLDALLIEASAFVKSIDASARAFCSWLSSNSSQIKREYEQTNAKIRVMTVHGAKGLEAPIVVLADAFSKPKSGLESILFSSHEGFPVPVLRKGEAKFCPEVSDVFDAALDEKYNEYYRLLYVALTRAEDEIYLGGVGSLSDSSSYPNWYDIVSQAMKSMGGAVESEHGLIIETKESESFKVRADKYPCHNTVAIDLPDWIFSPAPASNSSRSVYTPSSLVSYNRSILPPKNEGNVVDKGIIYHRMLQWIGKYAPASSEELKQWIMREAPYWDNDSIVSATKDIWALYTDSAYAMLWSAEALSEVNIAGNIEIGGKNYAFSGQIDLLIECDGYRVVIDYKTSRYVPTKDLIPESYLVQMLAYKRLLEADGSNIPVKTVLLYTAGPTIFWLDDVLANLTFPSLDAA